MRITDATILWTPSFNDNPLFAKTRGEVLVVQRGQIHSSRDRFSNSMPFWISPLAKLLESTGAKLSAQDYMSSMESVFFMLVFCHGIDPLIVRSRLAIIDEWSDMCSVYLSERNDAEAAQARVTPIRSNAVN